MSNSGFTWEIPPNVAFTQLFKWQASVIYEELAELAYRYAVEIEAWMKTNAPWTDRTANLRQSLYATVILMTGMVAIEFDYGLWYGVFLEFSNQGDYAIIAPALDHFAPLIRRDVKALLS